MFELGTLDERVLRRGTKQECFCSSGQKNLGSVKEAVWDFRRSKLSSLAASQPYGILNGYLSLWKATLSTSTTIFTVSHVQAFPDLRPKSTLTQ